MKGLNTSCVSDATTVETVTHDQIRRRAYELYVARKGGPGNPELDWLKAEQELKTESASAEIEPKPLVRSEVLLGSVDT